MLEVRHQARIFRLEVRTGRRIFLRHGRDAAIEAGLQRLQRRRARFDRRQGRSSLDGFDRRVQFQQSIQISSGLRRIAELLDLPAPQPLYLGSDDAPAREAEVLSWLREWEDLPAVAAASGAEAGRRIRNARLRATGWTPVFPDYRSGYADVLAKRGV